MEAALRQRPPQALPLGDDLGRRGLDVEHFYAEPSLEELDFDTARLAARDLVGAFESGLVDDVFTEDNLRLTFGGRVGVLAQRAAFGGGR